MGRIVDINRRTQVTIQTHSNLTVNASTWVPESVWHDSDGFSDIAVSMTIDVSVTTNAQILWSNDGVNTHGFDTILGSGTGTYRSALTTTKARYFKLSINNGDASSHVMNAWVYLKA